MVQTDLTTDDVATALRLNKATVQRLLKTGRLKGYQIGRAWRIPVLALDDFRAHNHGAGRSHNEPLTLPEPLSVIEDYNAWERLLLAENNLASAPAIPIEAMRRENIYEGQD